MRRKFAPVCCCLAAVLALAACSKRAPLPKGAPSGATAFPDLSIPLDLRLFEVVNNDRGDRGVFLKLSRLPDSVAYRDESDPARIVLDIKGPTGADSEEEVFPGGDSLVSRMRISRQAGNLRIILELVGSKPPNYSVHTMADWIMIRLGPSV